MTFTKIINNNSFSEMLTTAKQEFEKLQIQSDKKMADWLISLGAPITFDHTKHQIIVPMHMRELITNPPGWVTFSEYIKEDEMYLIDNKYLVEFI